MTFHVRDASNVLAEIGASFIRDPSNVLVEIGEEAIRDASGVHIYFALGGSFTVDVPPTVYGGAAYNGGIAVTTESAAVTITGGQGPFTYEWERTDGALGDWTIISPTAQSTAFRCIGVGIGESETAEFACTVRDANGSPVTSSNVLALVENYGGLGVPL